MALNQIRKLYGKFFKSSDDKLAIEEALKSLPSFAIFARFTKDSNTGQGLFDSASKSNSAHCLSAVMFFSDKQHSVMLWLATTNENAPTESIHFKWHNLGLSTYLLCMVLKQHTGYSNDMENSVISVQVPTHPAKLDVSRYFQWLGFLRLLEADNGLALTPDRFQQALEDYPTF